MNNAKNNTEEEKQRNKIVLSKEHEELIDVFIHVDTNGWNLVNFYIVMNFALVSAIGLLLTQESPEKLIWVIFTLCIMGFIIGILWFFLYGRLRMHHRIILFRLYEIENKLQSLNFPLSTMKNTFQKTHRGKTPLVDMTYKDPEGKLREMHSYELIEALRSVHIIMIVVSIIWLFVAIRFAYIAFTN